jgi:hypothetical protein
MRECGAEPAHAPDGQIPKFGAVLLYISAGRVSQPGLGPFWPPWARSFQDPVRIAQQGTEEVAPGVALLNAQLISFRPNAEIAPRRHQGDADQAGTGKCRNAGTAPHPEGKSPQCPGAAGSHGTAGEVLTQIVAQLRC